MRTIKCKGCGQIVQAERAVSLCPNCRAERAKAASLRQRTCRACGSSFLGGPRAWYCPECRAERAKAAGKAHKARAKAGTVRKIGSTDICQICGSEYTVVGGNQRYCPGCAPEAVRQIDRAHGKAWMAAHREEAQARKRELAAGRRVCAVCGEPVSSTRPTVTCSPACAKVLQAYRQAKADHKRRGSPLSTLEEVAARLARKTGAPGPFASIQEALQAIKSHGSVQQGNP